MLGALILSVVLHLLGVRFVHWGVPAAQEAPESLKLTKIYKVRATILHSPRPQPPQRKNVLRAPISVPKITSRGAHGPPAFSRRNVAAATATPSPAPTVAHLATPAGLPGCTKAYAVAAVVASPPPPDISSEARRAGTAGVTEVHVQLDASGSIVDAAVLSSSGNAQLDQVAVNLAKGSTYAPAISGCKKIASTYTYRVRFDAATTTELR
ncbi:MAG: energy transducer TonB [Candidatus Eremiobacteraeota bacterium]|nr:energy transducer TonB [Candidatus Eremiobacteraeota bacterium]